MEGFRGKFCPVLQKIRVCARNAFQPVGLTYKSLGHRPTRIKQEVESLQHCLRSLVAFSRPYRGARLY